MTDWMHPDLFKKLVKEAIRELQEEDKLKALGDDNHPMHQTLSKHQTISTLRKELDEQWQRTQIYDKQKSLEKLKKMEQKKEFDEARQTLERYHARKKNKI